MVGFVVVVAVLIDVLDPTPSSLSNSAQVAIALSGGAFFVALALFSTLLVVITVQDATLRFGRRGTVRATIRLTPTVEARVVRGDEAKKLRSNMNLALSPGGILIPFGQLGSAVGNASVGISAISSLRRGSGLAMSMWMREGVLVHAPDNIGRKVWLIGSQHADELVAAIQAQVAVASYG
jgi:hypothetical protein